MRAVTKRILGVIGFIAGLLILLMAVSRLLMPKNNTKEAGMQDPVANGILSEPDYTLDVVVLGDSETFCSIIPPMLYENYGITSYCCGTAGQILCTTYDFLYKAFNDQSPKIILLETNVIFKKFTAIDEIIRQADDLLPVFTYHNRWKYLSKRDLQLAVNYTDVKNGKGYLFSATINPADDSSYMLPSDEYETIPDKSVAYIENMKQYCEENGARLILFSSPSTKNWNMKRHNSVQKLCDEAGIEYIDMNLMQSEIPIDWQTDTRDKGDHLNHYGAQKVSAYMGEYLWQTGLFENHRSDDRYALWEKSLQDFNNYASTYLQK